MLLIDIDPDSFRAKVWLLVLDKIVIGAIIFGALAIYQHLETKESRDYAEDREEIQLAFKRAENLKELLPVVLDGQRENQLRAYMLGALMDTQSISSSSAVDLASQILYSDGGEPLAEVNSFLANTMVQVMSKGLGGLGAAIDNHSAARDRSTGYDKHWSIALFWQHVILKALGRAQVLGSEELNSPDFLVQNFGSLFRYQPPVVDNKVYEWSRSNVKGLRLLGTFAILDRASAQRAHRRDTDPDTRQPLLLPAHAERYLAVSSSDINEPALATMIVEKLHRDYVALPEVSNRILGVIQQPQVRDAVRQHTQDADRRVRETANWSYRALYYLAWSAANPDLAGQIEERVLPLVERFYDHVKSGRFDALDHRANLIDRSFVQVLMNTTLSSSSSHVPDEGTVSVLTELFSLSNGVLEQARINGLANDWSKRGSDIVIDEQGLWREREEYEQSRYE